MANNTSSNQSAVEILKQVSFYDPDWMTNPWGDDYLRAEVMPDGTIMLRLGDKPIDFGTEDGSEYLKPDEARSIASILNAAADHVEPPDGQ